jgi:hypothetical protein
MRELVGKRLVHKRWTDGAYVCRSAGVFKRGRLAGEQYVVVSHAKTGFQIQVLESQLKDWNVED